jgi:transcription antitermination factor NusB
MKTALDPRHANRQAAVSDLFAFGFHKQPIKNETAKLVTQNIKIIDEFIKEAAPEFSLDRINHIDLAVLRLAIYELVITHHEPTKVIIDEAIELAKEYGGEASPSFINGALGKVVTSQTRIKKLIADYLGTDEKHITPDANLRTDFNATDIEIADLLESLAIEKGVAINTVNDIYTYVEDQIP